MKKIVLYIVCLIIAYINFDSVFAYTSSGWSIKQTLNIWNITTASSFLPGDTKIADVQIFTGSTYYFLQPTTGTASLIQDGYMIGGTTYPIFKTGISGNKTAFGGGSPGPGVRSLIKPYNDTSPYSLSFAFGKLYNPRENAYYCIYDTHIEYYRSKYVIDPVYRTYDYICPLYSTGTTWENIDFNGLMPRSTCTDGIKNQDETDIDFGGVCGTNRICHIENIFSAKFPVYSDYSSGTVRVQTPFAYLVKPDTLLNIGNTAGYNVSIGGDIDSVSANLNGLFPNDFSLSGTGVIQTSSSGWLVSTEPYLDIETYGSTQYGNTLPVYTTGTYQSGTLQNGGLMSLYLSGTSYWQYRVSYAPITKDINGVEVEGGETYLTGSYWMQQPIFFDFPTRKIRLHFAKSATYNIKSIKIGTWYNTYTQENKCQTFTDADIAILGGSGGLDGVATVVDLQNYVANQSKLSKWNYDNPLLDALKNGASELMDSLGLNGLVNYMKIYVPTLPVRSITYPKLVLPNSVSSGSISVTQDIATFTGLTLVTNSLNFSSVDGSKYLYWIVVIGASIAWLIFVLLMFTIPAVIPMLIVSVIHSVMDMIVPGLTDSEGSPGNIWTLFSSILWWSFVVSVYSSTFVLINYFSNVLVDVKNNVLAVLTLPVTLFAKYADFQLWANSLLTFVISGLIVFFLYLLLNQKGHIS